MEEKQTEKKSFFFFFIENVVNIQMYFNCAYMCSVFIVAEYAMFIVNNRLMRPLQ